MILTYKINYDKVIILHDQFFSIEKARLMTVDDTYTVKIICTFYRMLYSIIQENAVETIEVHGPIYQNDASSPQEMVWIIM